MPPKPSNWYSMDYAERREWERTARAIEDAEYDAERAKESAERAERDTRRAAEDAKRERCSHEEEREILNEEISELQTALAKERAAKDGLLAACKNLREVLALQPAPKLGEWNWPQMVADLDKAIAKAEDK